MSGIEKRFKILAPLCIELGVFENQMSELADAIDNGHPKSEEALTFFEDKVIEILGS